MLIKLYAFYTKMHFVYHFSLFMQYYYAANQHVRRTQIAFYFIRIVKSGTEYVLRVTYCQKLRKTHTDIPNNSK